MKSITGKYFWIIPILLIPVLIWQCSEEGINLFTLDQDIEFGLQMNEQIEANTDQFPVLDPSQYADAYGHLRRIRDVILESPEIRYKTDFAWEVKIIDNDSVLNAFAVPGGYLYFYTGLIKYLDSEDQFAGVMAHEIAHVDKRHSTQTLTKQYGLSLLLDLLLGNNESAYIQIASDLAQGLAGLEFSRNHEYEADEYAVRYMYSSTYDSRGVKGFFEKLEGAPRVPVFLSTHPSPEDRIEKILETWDELGSRTGETYGERYQRFKESLEP